MIIRNGFVRSEEGNWINLYAVSRFYVEVFYNGDGGVSYVIKGEIEGSELLDDDTFSQVLDDEGVLQKILDAAFGGV